MIQPPNRPLLFLFRGDSGSFSRPIQEKLFVNAIRIALAESTFLIHLLVVDRAGLSAFDWVPTDAELNRYHSSWNPRTHGANYSEDADLVLQGQWSIRTYVQGQIGHGNFENQSTTRANATPFSPDAVEPDVIVNYGLTKYLNVGLSMSAI